MDLEKLLNEVEATPSIRKELDILIDKLSLPILTEEDIDRVQEILHLNKFNGMGKQKLNYERDILNGLLLKTPHYIDVTTDDFI